MAMSLRSNILGGETSLVQPDGILKKGIYSRYPAQTPKYGQQGPEGTYAEDVARFYITLADPKSDWSNFVIEVSNHNPDAGPIALGVTTGKEDNRSYGYVDFMLESITTSFSEKAQVNEVLTDNYVAYFYGQRAPVFTLSGKLLDTRQDDWAVAFNLLYNSVFRGTRMATLKQVVHLRYNRRIVTGVLTAFSETSSAYGQLASEFNCTMLVKEYLILPEPEWRPTHLKELHGVIDNEYQTVFSIDPDGGRVLERDLSSSNPPAQFRTTVAETTTAG